MKKFCFVMIVAAISGSLLAQTPPGDILGQHNLSPGSGSTVTGPGSAACLYCHAPHSSIGGRTPLWSQTLSSQTYTLYSSNTLQNIATQPPSGSRSSLCLSCHDGTVGMGSKVPYGNISISGSMRAADVFGTQLQGSHPFSLRTPLADASHLFDSLASQRKTDDEVKNGANAKVIMVDGNVECRSCHEPHAEKVGDVVAGKFLVRDNANGQLCLACHTSSAREVNGNKNPLTQWSTSIHATSAGQVNGSAGLGSYSTVGQFACLSCHKSHNANGPAQLLRTPNPPVTGMDTATQSCITCHNGSSNLQLPIANVYGEFASPKVGHPLPAGSNTHDANEPAVLVNNRHATCADCHNPHSALQVSAFGAAPTIRVSQAGTSGVSASDGATVIRPAANQYETCLRCHGTSPGKQALAIFGYLPVRQITAPGDPLNVLAQFNVLLSSHPVMHARSNGLPQPSLRAAMLNLDGNTSSSRTLNVGDSIFCSDCHNADDNREFGGAGPNGPHGSQYSHVLERRYEFSQVAVGAGPGTPLVNADALKNPNLSAGGANPGPYALCGKCHDLSVLMLDNSFSEHSKHVSEAGVSCSVCHTAHGSPSGGRLVNFDLNVVAPNQGVIAYNAGAHTCTLTCHGESHNANGTVNERSVQK